MQTSSHKTFASSFTLTTASTLQIGSFHSMQLSATLYNYNIIKFKLRSNLLFKIISYDYTNTIK